MVEPLASANEIDECEVAALGGFEQAYWGWRGVSVDSGTYVICVVWVGCRESIRCGHGSGGSCSRFFLRLWLKWSDCAVDLVWMLG